MKEIDPPKKLTDIIMFDGATNVQLLGRILKVHYPKLTVMRGVEHTVSLFFNDVYKIPIVHQTISAHKMMYNLLVLVYIISHSPFLNQMIKSFTIKTLVFLAEKNFDGWIFNGDAQRLADAKFPQYTISSSEFIGITSNNKFDKAVKYIHDNKS